MKEFKKLLQFADGYKFMYLLGMITIVISQIFNTIGPLIISNTVDSIVGSEPISSKLFQYLVNVLGGKSFLANNLWIMGLIIVLNTGLRGVFLYFKNTLSSKSSENIAMRIRNKLYDHIQRLPYEYHVKAETGELIQKCTSDVDTIRKFLAIQLVEVSGSLFMLFFILYIMMTLNKKMVLISFVLVPFIFSFAFIFFKRVQRDFEKADESEASLSTTLQENLTGIRVVKAFAREKHEMDKFEVRNTDYRNKVNKLILNLAMYWSISDFFSIIQVALVIIIGSHFVIINEMSLGTLIAFVSYVNMMIWPIRQLGRTLTDMGKATVSIKRIDEILVEPIEIIKETGETPNIYGNIDFTNVSFSYEKDSPVLKDISFSVKAGQTIAIIGSTGSGKSSLVHLLPRLYEYDSGSIKIDGIELNTIDKYWIRKNVGLVLQEPFLYAKTIKENIKLTDPTMVDDRVFEAAKVASIHDDIVSFEYQYETVVGERGVSLSGGQKQRMAIARTIINECPIVVFDDSLSAVDTETDVSIRKALNSRKNKATTIIISHRISTVSEADKIIVIDKGKIVQSGTHKDLINEEGLYKRVYNIQSSFEDDIEME
ncbi:ABC transporter ATP-binding protein [Tissierella sp. Yu-01]|uniref:ABC transporter ATP-binding protein n=1 Tax=Tissierella sp. Yu-01 TaxID=3035694 RepID=UPI00240E111D|nr:ABC transporter ATP-binding protein [Tissierella sp. Yu-01]WFA10394.1 ABC transporter ATP-binding protein [Tissierella sp. Yu-01]